MKTVDDNNHLRIEAILDDIYQWPDSWKGDERDVIVGKVILDAFMRYLESLLNKGRTKATVRKHANYLWALGGEIITDLHENENKTEDLSFNLLFNYVDSCGGPYWPHAHSDEELRQYDSVCRALYKFLCSL